jgi:hypothetical protein
MAAGRTRPILLECVRGTAARRERARFVTKGLGLPEIYAFSLAHEFLGGQLARLFGLNAPRVEVVTLSSPFIDATQGDLAAAGLQLRPGLAVGTEFIPDLLPYPVPVQLSDTELVEAAAIYAFDLLTQNPDRSTRSPNCGRVAYAVVPYDFEAAFSFRFAIGRPNPWKVGELPFARTHLFHRALRQSHVDWMTVFQRFKAVTTAGVAEVCSTIPPAWADVGEEVRTHVTAVLDHWPQFEHEVTISLGNTR